jgi:hypothetical protein
MLNIITSHAYSSAIMSCGACAVIFDDTLCNHRRKVHGLVTGGFPAGKTYNFKVTIKSELALKYRL